MIKTIYILLLNLLIVFAAFASNAKNDLLEKETQLNIYPNPVMSGQEISVDIELNEHELVHLCVYDFSGRLVLEFTNLQSEFSDELFTNKILIEEKGMYLLKMIIENKNTHFKKSKVKKLYVI